MSTIEAVLFDLDGTLLDTAPDLVFALNVIREQHGLPAMPVSDIRPIANLGSKAMLKRALDLEVDETDPRFQTLRQQFFSLYLTHLADSTQFFPNIEKVLTHLDELSIPWGIVTNKPTAHTMGLLKALGLEQRTNCVVCGDTLPKNKPDPLPILHACQLLKANPAHCIYIGDAETDVIASKAANTTSLIALYGYINQDDDPLTWKADGYIKQPIDIIEWLTQFSR